MTTVNTSMAGTTGSRSLLRRMNTVGVLSQLRTEPLTVRELVDRLSVSRTAVESVLADLELLGWVTGGPAPSAAAERRAGRPSRAFRLRAEQGHVAALDIGAHHVQAMLADLAGNVIVNIEANLAEDMPAKRRLSAAERTLDACLAQAGISRDDLWILVVGTPGVVSEGTVHFFGGRGMPGWVGLDLGAHFSERMGCQTLVENDQNLGALGELWAGEARSRSDVVYIYSGVRTGAALIIDGALRRGKHGATGLVGELPELRWLEIEGATSPTEWSDSEGGSVRRTFTAARRGDRAAVTAVARFADALALGAASLVLALDPELVIIGGPSSADADVFLDEFRDRLASRCPFEPEVRASTLGASAAGLGAVSLALDAIWAAVQVSVPSSDAFPLCSRDAVLRADTASSL